MQKLRVVSDHPSPGALAGGLFGVAVGLLLAAIWLYGAWDVALAVTAVFGGLVAVLIAGSSAWRPFATGLLVSACVAGGVLLAIDSYR